jgi:DNA-binding NarL/FixJ family response regulator
MRRVVVVERPDLFAKGLSAALGTFLPDYDIRLASDLVSARRAIDLDETPELALVDVDMPDSTWASLRSLRRQYPRMRLLAMCEKADRADAIHCLENGLAGCFSKTQPVEEILEAVKDVLSGRFYAAPTVGESEQSISASLVPSSDQSVPLMSERDGDRLTPRQREILPLIAAGMSNKEIARALKIAEGRPRYMPPACFGSSACAIGQRLLSWPGNI